MAGIGAKVCVAVRVRPLIERENNSDAVVNWKVDNNVIQQIDYESQQRVSTTSYTFDHVFVRGTKEVYDNVVAPIVDQAFNGFNGTVLCYGQTSSGKTYTLYGNDDENGIISLAAQDLFRRISDDQSRTYIIRVGLVEIYMEKVSDLLHEGQKEIQIVEVNGSVVPKDLEEIQILRPEDMLEAAQRIQKERKIGETRMNKESSRSHTILRILIESVPRIPNADDGENVHVTNALLNFVDLAGSEKAGQSGAQGERLKEATYINKSLSVLSQVVMQLSEGVNIGTTPAAQPVAPSRLTSTGTALSKKGTSRFVNYRDSKLTRILQSSLNGNAFIAMICNITPASVDETHSTLRFARNAKNIIIEPKINRVLASNTEYQQKIKELQNLLYGKSSEVEGLKRQLGVYMKFCQSNSIDVLNKPVVPNPAYTDRRKTFCASVFLANREDVSKTNGNALGTITEIPTKRKAISSSRTSLDSPSSSYAEKFMSHEEVVKHFDILSSNNTARDSWSDVGDDGLLTKEELRKFKFDAEVQTSPEPPKPKKPRREELTFGTPKGTLRLTKQLAAEAFEEDIRELKNCNKHVENELASVKSTNDDLITRLAEAVSKNSILEAKVKELEHNSNNMELIEKLTESVELIDKIAEMEFKNNKVVVMQDVSTWYSPTKAIDASTSPTESKHASTWHSPTKAKDASTWYTPTKPADTSTGYSPTKSADASTWYSPAKADAATWHSPTKSADAATWHSPAKAKDASTSPTKSKDVSTWHSPAKAKDASTTPTDSKDISTWHSPAKAKDASTTPTESKDASTWHSPDKAKDASTSPTESKDSSTWYSPTKSADASTWYSPTKSADASTWYSPTKSADASTWYSPTKSSDASTWYSPTKSADASTCYSPSESKDASTFPPDSKDASTCHSPTKSKDASTCHSPTKSADVTTWQSPNKSKDVSTWHSPTKSVDASTCQSPITSKDVSTWHSPSESKDASTSPPDSKDASTCQSPIKSKDASTWHTPTESKDASTSSTESKDASTSSTASKDASTCHSPTKCADASTCQSPIKSTDASTWHTPTESKDASTSSTESKDASTSSTASKDASTCHSPTKCADASTCQSPIKSTDASTWQSPIKSKDASTWHSPTESKDASTSSIASKDASTWHSPTKCADASTCQSPIKSKDASTCHSLTESKDASTSPTECKDVSTCHSPVKSKDASTCLSSVKSKDASSWHSLTESKDASTSTTEFKDVSTCRSPTTSKDASTWHSPTKSNDTSTMSDSLLNLTNVEINTDISGRVEPSGISGSSRIRKVNRTSQTDEIEDQTENIRNLKRKCFQLHHKVETLEKAHKNAIAKEKQNLEETQVKLAMKNSMVDELERRIVSVKTECMAKKPTNIVETQCDFMQELLTRSMKGERGLLPAGYPEIGKVASENTHLRQKMLMSAMEKGKAEKDAQQRLGNAPLTSIENIQLDGSHERMKFSKPAMIKSSQPLKLPIHLLSRKPSSAQCNPVPVIPSVSSMLLQSSTSSAVNGKATASSKPSTSVAAQSSTQSVSTKAEVPQAVATQSVAPPVAPQDIPNAGAPFGNDDDDMDEEAYVLELERILAQGYQ